jgi:hypothetical protein
MKAIKQTMKFSVKFAIVITILVLLLNLIPREYRRIKKSDSLSHHVKEMNIKNGQKTQAQIFYESVKSNTRLSYMSHLGDR